MRTYSADSAISPFLRKGAQKTPNISDLPFVAIKLSIFVSLMPGSCTPWACKTRKWTPVTISKYPFGILLLVPKNDPNYTEFKFCYLRRWRCGCFLLAAAADFCQWVPWIVLRHPVSRVRQSKRLIITSLPIIQLKLLEHGVFKLGICRRNIRLSVKWVMTRKYAKSWIHC